jgi:hypothetical protein
MSIRTRRSGLTIKSEVKNLVAKSLYANGFPYGIAHSAILPRKYLPVFLKKALKNQVKLSASDYCSAARSMLFKGTV